MGSGRCSVFSCRLSVGSEQATEVGRIVLPTPHASLPTPRH